ncbi:hypothetical protein BC828DRAFT_244277 [Blastocladiella britannica]|nr:hypothetical protein BC828DRAFT_244277 [Blastocladiella britannica]
MRWRDATPPRPWWPWVPTAWLRLWSASTKWSILAQILVAHHALNIQRAYLLYELGRLRGDHNSEFAVARLYLNEASSEKHAEAETILRSLATRGHPHAQQLLGRRYASDPEKQSAAIDLFVTAAKNGVTSGWIEAGRLLLASDQYDAANAHFQSAVNAGDPAGHHALAISAQKRGSSPDDIVAHTMRAAEAGVPEAQHNLGTMYLNGYGGSGTAALKKDPKKAERWFAVAASRYPPAAFNLALLAKARGDAKAARRGLEKCAQVPGKLGQEARSELADLDRRESSSGGGEQATRLRTEQSFGCRIQ